MRDFAAWINSFIGVKSPAADGPTVAPSRTITDQGYTVHLDLTDQVLAIDAPADEGWAYDLDEEAFAPGERTLLQEAPLRATLAQTERFAPPEMLSAAVLAQKGKIFDDGLYAAVEVAAQDGAGRHPGKPPPK